MISNPAGNILTETVSLPLLGRSVMQFLLVDNSGTPVRVDPVGNTITFAIYQNPDDMRAVPPIPPIATVTLATVPGVTIDSPSTSGSIEVELSPAQALLLSQQWLYTFVITIVDVVSGQTILSRSGYLLPILSSIAQAYEITTTSSIVALFTTSINTLVLAGPQGGAGYLDGLTTVTQAVNCVVQYNDGNGQPRQWILEISTAASDAGHQRPLDYNGVTNTKVWRKIM